MNVMIGKRLIQTEEAKYVAKFTAKPSDKAEALVIQNDVVTMKLQFIKVNQGNRYISHCGTKVPLVFYRSNNALELWEPVEVLVAFFLTSSP